MTVLLVVVVLALAGGLLVVVSVRRTRSVPQGADLVRRDSRRPVGTTMRRKAEKHFRLAGRTLVVRAEPAVVAGLVAVAVEATRARFRPTDALEPGEAAAWEAESIFGPYPRLVVRASPLVPGATEIGATRMKVSICFPQGGPFVTRGVGAAQEVLERAGLPVEVVTRVFVPGPHAAWGSDGVWFVDEVMSAAETMPRRR